MEIKVLPSTRDIGEAHPGYGIAHGESSEDNSASLLKHGRLVEGFPKRGNTEISLFERYPWKNVLHRQNVKISFQDLPGHVDFKF